MCAFKPNWNRRYIYIYIYIYICAYIYIFIHFSVIYVYTLLCITSTNILEGVSSYITPPVFPCPRADSQSLLLVTLFNTITVGQLILRSANVATTRPVVIKWIETNVALTDGTFFTVDLYFNYLWCPKAWHGAYRMGFFWAWFAVIVTSKNEIYHSFDDKISFANEILSTEWPCKFQ